MLVSSPRHSFQCLCRYYCCCYCCYCCYCHRLLSLRLPHHQPHTLSRASQTSLPCWTGSASHTLGTRAPFALSPALWHHDAPSVLLVLFSSCLRRLPPHSPSSSTSLCLEQDRINPSFSSS